MRSLPYYYVRLRPDFAWAGRTFHVRRRCGGVIPWTRPGREMTRTRSSGRETRARKEGRMNDHHRCRTIHLALGHERGVRRVVEDLGRKPLPIYRVASTGHGRTLPLSLPHSLGVGLMNGRMPASSVRNLKFVNISTRHFPEYYVLQRI